MPRQNEKGIMKKMK